MKILGIETSCDETSVAALEAGGGRKAPRFRVLAATTHSQIDAHRAYGGVYPTLAKREHGKNLVPVLLETLTNAGLMGSPTSKIPEVGLPKMYRLPTKELQNIFEREPELLAQFTEIIPSIEKPALDAIAVTVGPGLQPALWVGVNFARALSLVWDIPLIGSNHLEGHLISPLLTPLGKESRVSASFPAVGLIVSGGHTELVHMEGWGNYMVLGRTRDDAAGEAFDKVARILGLPYPGGSALATLAAFAAANTENFPLMLPRPMIHSGDYDFSFSGLKTAVLYATRERPELLSREPLRAALAHEFEEAVVDVLIAKTKKALEHTAARSLIVGGGVAANTKLRAALSMLAEESGIPLLLPLSEYTGDNAAMIAAAGYLHANEPSAADLEAHGTLSL